MRQTRNFRYTARGRPQSWHRCSCRELNFGVRFAFAIFDLLAMPDRLGISVVWGGMILLLKTSLPPEGVGQPPVQLSSF